MAIEAVVGSGGGEGGGDVGVVRREKLMLMIPRLVRYQIPMQRFCPTKCKNVYDSV